MQMSSADPVIYPDGTEDTRYQCSACQTELISTRLIIDRTRSLQISR